MFVPATIMLYLFYAIRAYVVRKGSHNYFNLPSVGDILFDKLPIKTPLY